MTELLPWHGPLRHPPWSKLWTLTTRTAATFPGIALNQVSDVDRLNFQSLRNNSAGILRNSELSGGVCLSAPYQVRHGHRFHASDSARWYVGRRAAILFALLITVASDPRHDSKYRARRSTNCSRAARHTELLIAYSQKQWKVLVVDGKSRKLIDNVMREDDILNENITSMTGTPVVRRPQPKSCLTALPRYRRDRTAAAHEQGHGRRVHTYTGTAHRGMPDGRL